MESIGGSITALQVEKHVSTPTLQIVSDNDLFDALKTDWDQLLEECDASIYQSYEWQRTWWKHFGEKNRSASLHIVVVKRGGRVIGIAPFFIEKIRTLGFIGYRRLAFIGQGPSDYLDVVFARGDEAVCADLVATHLAASSDLFDVIHLEDFTDRFPNHTLLFEALKRKAFRGRHFINEYCPRTTLLESWEDTLASFKIDNRREIRRRQRNLHKNFAIEYEAITGETDAASGIEEFIVMHQQKWQNEGHSGVFAESRMGKFHREVAQLFARRGWLFLTFLSANGTKAAALYCFLFRDDLAVYLTGNANRSDVFKFSPGRVLTAYCMEEAVKQGKKVCDFMRGTEQYKYELDAKDIPNWAVLMYNPHSTRPELRHKIDLLVRSLHRRSTRERLLFKVVAKEHGWFSKEAFEHIKTRFKQNIKDGMMKAKAPERATNVRPKSNGEANGQSDGQNIEKDH